jgi:hypothetical protein
LQIGHLFTTSNGEISQLIMPDYLHLSEAGYQIWADAILPHLVEKNQINSQKSTANTTLSTWSKL